MAIKTENQISLELMLLLLCLEDNLYGSKKDEIIKICSEAIDWDKFQKLAVRHKVIQLIYVTLNKKYRAYVPDNSHDEIKKVFLLNCAHNLYFTAVFHKIIDYFNENNMTCVPLKGPVISEQLYGDISLRVFSDLDILVPEENAFQAFNLLITKGFTPELNLNKKQFEAYMNSEDHMILTLGKKKLIVELHWELSDRYLSKPFTFEQIKHQLCEYNFNGKKILTFSREDLLVYLCLHGSKHIWENFELIFLIATLLKSDLDWEKILLLARTTRCYKKLLLGASLCSRFFNCALPDKIRSLIADSPEIKKLDQYVTLLLLAPIENHLWDISKSKFTRYQFASLDRFQDKIRYFFFMVLFPTNNDWTAAAIPGKYSFLYYFTRPVRLFYNLLKQKSRLIRKGFKWITNKVH